MANDGASSGREPNEESPVGLESRPELDAISTLRTNKVSVVFGGLTAVDEVDLELDCGEIVGLIGPNGSGKTTLINVASGLQRPTSGHVTVDEVDLTKRPTHNRVKSGIARTFQDLRLFPNLSVFENAEVGALGVGMGRAEVREATREVLSRFGLLEIGHLPAKSLNHVLQRQLSIARALTAKPKFVLLDEPGAGLSEDETEDLLRTLVGIRTSLGCGLLVIEHDMKLIMRLCDRIHVLNEGKTIAVGAPADIQRDPSVIKAYLGE